MSPFVGEGAAMLDAAVLAEFLPEHEDDVETALARYEADMFPRPAEAARQSAFAARPRPPLGLKSELRGSCGFGRTLTR